VIDILEVGVGGGSIAWLDDQRRLNVGPRSAGSCRGRPLRARRRRTGRHRRQPRVGRLDPGNFLGGEMRLEASKAREVLDRRIAGPLGYHGEDASPRGKGVLTIANLTMSSIIRRSRSRAATTRATLRCSATAVGRCTASNSRVR
jgi:N-methylhydantoinase A/oxoprolinase/acetone carboxylase beta subunit